MDKPWFVQRRSRTSFALEPNRWQGWAAAAVYVAVALAITPLAEQEEWLAWGALLIIATLTLILVAWRTSAPAPKL